MVAYVSDRPSRHPTGRVALPEIPRAPRPPQVELSLTESAVVPVADEVAPASVPTSPPPPVFTELQRMSRRPSPVPPSTPDEPRHHDSRSFTLPGPHAVAKLLIDPADLNWFELGEETRALVPLIDGVRTVALIARERRIPPREAQLRIADLRSRGIVEIF
jgi:hypothetical protein